MKRLVIIGAGGQGKVCAEVAALSGYNNIIFLDDGATARLPVAGPVDSFTTYLSDSDFFIGIGNNTIRREFTRRFERSGANIVTLIHPAATVSKDAVIGKGVIVMPGAVVNPGAVIGKGAILNTSCSVDHDCQIGEFAHIAVGAHLAGSVAIGEATLIGAGAIIINNLSVPAESIIGAGAVVIRNLTKRGTYVGVPTRKIK